MAQPKEAAAKAAATKSGATKAKVNKDGFEVGKPIESSTLFAFLAKKRQERKEAK